MTSVSRSIAPGDAPAGLAGEALRKEAVVRSTPFGAPTVPEVNSRMSGSEGATSRAASASARSSAGEAGTSRSSYG
ncbi:hypothetical protein ACFSWD_03060 [Paenibacillus xanthanilyticus]